VALFDADHRCEKNYLRMAMPLFFNEDGTCRQKIGLVQTPWAYYNTHQNILVSTKQGHLQARLVSVELFTDKCSFATVS
jgi:cellulose synthase/poly-beta-1,6-N-acetylglucosamine synthase-like glycosyltransferase